MAADKEQGLRTGGMTGAEQEVEGTLVRESEKKLREENRNGTTQEGNSATRKERTEKQQMRCNRKVRDK